MLNTYIYAETKLYLYPCLHCLESKAATVLIVLGSDLILTITATAVTIKGSFNPTEMATNISMCVIFLYIQQQSDI